MAWLSSLVLNGKTGLVLLREPKAVQERAHSPTEELPVSPSQPPSRHSNMNSPVKKWVQPETIMVQVLCCEGQMLWHKGSLLGPDGMCYIQKKEEEASMGAWWTWRSFIHPLCGGCFAGGSRPSSRLLRRRGQWSSHQRKEKKRRTTSRTRGKCTHKAHRTWVTPILIGVIVTDCTLCFCA